MSSSVSATVAREYAADAERVFDAWLDPGMLQRWMFGPEVRDEEIVHVQVDARVGGRFSFAVRRGKDIIDHVGEYLEIERPRRLAFTWGVAGESEGESRVIIDIQPREAGCRVVLTHEMAPQWAEYRDRAAASWGFMLDRLAKLLA